MKLLILFCILLVFLTACTEYKTMVDEDFIWTTPSEEHLEIMKAMKKAGYTGEHKLVKLGGFMGVDGKLDGSWGILGGSVHSSISSAVYVKYVWYVAEKRPFIHTFPFDRIDLVIDNECVEPTIRYQFRIGRIKHECLTWLTLYGKWQPYVSGSPQEGYEAAIPEMLIGSIISLETVAKATVVISQKQLDAREYLLW